MEESKLFTIEDFINDLNRVTKFKDNRVLVWYCNLYIEHYILLLFKENNINKKFQQCKECHKSSEPTFLMKVKELSNAGLIDINNTHDKLIEMIYKARNSAGHGLNFNELKIIENIIKVTSEARKEDPLKSIEKLTSNITPWKNLEVSSMAVVARLYMNLKQIKGIPLKEKLIFEINPECTNISPKIIDKSDYRF